MKKDQTIKNIFMETDLSLKMLSSMSITASINSQKGKKQSKKVAILFRENTTKQFSLHYRSFFYFSRRIYFLTSKSKFKGTKHSYKFDIKLSWIYKYILSFTRI
jgi:hypothetical protein